MTKEFTSVVTLKFGINNIEANTKEEYIQKLKDSYYEQYNIEICDQEITSIQENKLWKHFK